MGLNAVFPCIEIFKFLLARDVFRQFFDRVVGYIKEFHPRLIRLILKDDFDPFYFSDHGYDLT
jgi:hypothetical protein